MNKLYLISQDRNSGYDTFDSAVVVAENEEAARQMLPADWADVNNTWAEPQYVTVKYLGETTEPVGPVCASFNAG